MTGERTWGPIITAIEAGHHNTGKNPGHCEADGERWPCAAIKAARKAQEGYARNLQRHADMRTGRLDLGTPRGR